MLIARIKKLENKQKLKYLIKRDREEKWWDVGGLWKVQ